METAPNSRGIFFPSCKGGAIVMFEAYSLPILQGDRLTYIPGRGRFEYDPPSTMAPGIDTLHPLSFGLKPLNDNLHSSDWFVDVL